MKAKEVMEKYNITRPTLCAWTKEGKINAVKLPNGQYDYKEITVAPVPTNSADSITSLQDVEAKAISDMLKVTVDFYEFMVKINFMGPEFLKRAKAMSEEYEDVYNKISKR